MIYVISGTEKQFDNFLHITGSPAMFTRLRTEESITGVECPVVLLIGTWYEMPGYDRILARIKMRGGQAFAKMGARER